MDVNKERFILTSHLKWSLGESGDRICYLYLLTPDYTTKAAMYFLVNNSELLDYFLKEPKPE